MNDRTKIEFEEFCPDCGAALFHPGPRGGAARNIKCAGCGSKFWYCPPFTPERIDNGDEFYQLDVRCPLLDILDCP